MSVPTQGPESEAPVRKSVSNRLDVPRVVPQRRGSAVDWLIGALLVFALVWTVGTVTGHSIVWVAVAWGVVVVPGAMVLRALERRRGGD